MFLLPFPKSLKRSQTSFWRFPYKLTLLSFYNTYNSIKSSHQSKMEFLLVRSLYYDPQIRGEHLLYEGSVEGGGVGKIKRYPQAHGLFRGNAYILVGILNQLI